MPGSRRLVAPYGTSAPFAFFGRSQGEFQMAFLKLLGVALGLIVTLAIVAGCDGALEPHRSASDTSPAVTFDGSSHERSWMLAEAQKQPSLLYIANRGTSDVS